MSDATKVKLMKLTGIDQETADKLEAAGMTLPIHIKDATDTKLRGAGLSTAKVEKLRAKLPKKEK